MLKIKNTNLKIVMQSWRNAMLPVCWGYWRGQPGPPSPADLWTDFSRGSRCYAQGWPGPGCPPLCRTPGRWYGCCTVLARCTTRPREELPSNDEIIIVSLFPTMVKLWKRHGSSSKESKKVWRHSIIWRLHFFWFLSRWSTPLPQINHCVPWVPMGRDV